MADVAPGRVSDSPSTLLAGWQAWESSSTGNIWNSEYVHRGAGTRGELGADSMAGLVTRFEKLCKDNANLQQCNSNLVKELRAVRSQNSKLNYRIRDLEYRMSKNRDLESQKSKKPVYRKSRGAYTVCVTL